MVTESNYLSSTCPSYHTEFANPGNDEEGLPVTLLYSKVTRQVLCIETGKEFVDLLLGFLTLPLGCIIKLLGEASLLDLPQDSLAGSPDEKVGTQNNVSGSNSKDERVQQKKEVLNPSPMNTIANLYASIARMEEAYLIVDKSILLDPRPAATFGGKLLSVPPVKVKKEKPIEYYCCGIACNFVCTKQGTKCPRHKRRMDTPCKQLDDESEQQPLVQMGGAAGLARDGQFIVTNSLEIYPSSSIKGLMHLNMLKSERVSDLENLEIFVGTEEILQLLKVSLCSGNVLNKVFGKHCPRPPPTPFYVYRHLDSAGGRICPPGTKAANLQRPASHGGF